MGSSCAYGRYLEPEYRKTLAVQEMLGYRADVLCLQEVDEKAFTGYLLPHMRHAGAAAAVEPSLAGVNRDAVARTRSAVSRCGSDIARRVLKPQREHVA